MAGKFKLTLINKDGETIYTDDHLDEKLFSSMIPGQIAYVAETNITDSEVNGKKVKNHRCGIYKIEVHDNGRLESIQKISVDELPANTDKSVICECLLNNSK